ncbi:XYPPX repeat family protein [Histomonas meleagridis]|uniref:XYPPX repeat family protein n=1 Tax=Histomonas meleagridis TaxID=135588 RepID=UPI00355A275E|nr:XYPPX repeat family protein [Histomonas meleagridis]KAH0803602.1 XYPPX repeat family protein [Histomonas meleagridis]
MSEEERTPLLHEDQHNSEEQPTINEDELYLKVFAKRQRNDGLFALIFLANLFITLIISIALISYDPDRYYEAEPTSKILALTLVPPLASICFVLIFAIFQIYVPNYFISASYFVSAGLFIITFVLYMLIFKNFSAIILIPLTAESIALVVTLRSYKKSSISLLSSISNIQTSNPKLLLFTFIMNFISIIPSTLYIWVSHRIQVLEWSKFLHILLALSYFWINSFISHFCIFVSSGFTILNIDFGGTLRMPRSPILLLVKHAIMSSLGTIAYSAFVSPYLWLARLFPYIKYTKLIEQSEITLVYCAAFGIDFGAGDMRQQELERSTKMVSLADHSQVYSSSLMFSMAIASFAGIAGYLVSNGFVVDPYALGLIVIFTVFLTFFRCCNFVSLIGGIADTLFVLTGNAPSKMKKSFPILFSDLSIASNYLGH